MRRSSVVAGSIASSGPIVVGAGIAGLSMALEVGDCTIVTRGALGHGASGWAQGGLAAAMGPDDRPADHADDTVRASSGLTIPEVVELVAGSAPDRIGWLRQLGTAFDVDSSGRLVLGREAGHGADRIVHGGGDATGATVMAALVAAIRARADIEVVEQHQAVDLLSDGDRIIGVLSVDHDGRRWARTGTAVVLATGGLGQVYERTTNPPEATGDGLAMALRAGATIRDPEFVQFHPTALDVPLDPTPLLTEALRGAGATLVDAAGHRYLPAIHPDAELAPRDVVARANWMQQQHGPIYLDARTIGADLPERFPTVFATAMAAGIDPRVKPLPVTPVQHYHIGGVATDAWARTDLPGLLAIGEVASTGLHGANRLASNSLVEALVFAARAAEVVRAGHSDGSVGPAGSSGEVLVPADGPLDGHTVGPLDGHTGDAVDGAPGDAVHQGVPPLDDELATAVRRLRTVMWQAGGLVRDAAGLGQARGEVARLRPVLQRSVTSRNLGVVAELILRTALERTGSRGAHFRADHPEPEPGEGAHTTVREPAEHRVPITEGSTT